MKRFIVPEELLTAITRYLCGKPFGEVHLMIQAIQGLPDYVEPEKKPEEKPDGHSD